MQTTQLQWYTDTDWKSCLDGQTKSAANSTHTQKWPSYATAFWRIYIYLAIQYVTVSPNTMQSPASEML